MKEVEQQVYNNLTDATATASWLKATAEAKTIRQARLSAAPARNDSLPPLVGAVVGLIALSYLAVRNLVKWRAGWAQ